MRPSPKPDPAEHRAIADADPLRLHPLHEVTMLPDPLHNALPAIARGAVRVAPDPRLSPGYQWPAAERPHTIALAYERGTTDGLDVGCHRLRGGVRT